ncbi:MAG: FtsW/RodA/SpoVE family cell cycle protein [Firmicutes bacterium]|nr:FtsW/RodA/SpoVE family cell cycle protein [Bacillota bacterium]
MEYNTYSTSRHTQREVQPAPKNRVVVGGVNWVILITTILLLSFGMVMVFSASYDKYGYYYLSRNIIWALSGGVLMLIFSQINYNGFNNRQLALALYALSIVLLILVLVLGRSVGGAKRRIAGIQPSEFVKVFTIIILAHMLDTNKKFTETHKGFWTCLIAFVGVPVGLILLGNASTAIILAVVCLAMMFTVVKSYRWFFEVGLVGVVGFIGMISFGKGFRAARINAWLDPFKDTSDTGYQVVHSLYAVASGGLSGLGLGNSREKLSYLPEAHNDMIFSIICEELGLPGAAMLVILFCVLIFCGYRAAIKCYNTFGSLVAVGITTMIAFQVIINMGVATNTIPNTGIPMPFISYGGSSLWINMVSIGILLSISRFFKDNRKLKKKE